MVEIGSPTSTQVRRESRLIERHMYDAPFLTPDRARLTDSGVPVWALVGYYRAVQEDPRRVAKDYELPLSAVLAALAYYRRNQAVIDARLTLNAAP